MPITANLVQDRTGWAFPKQKVTGLTLISITTETTADSSPQRPIIFLGRPHSKAWALASGLT